MMDKQQQIVSRNSYINSLKHCINSSKAAIEKVLGVFGWTEELTDTENDWQRDRVPCSVDPTHIVLSQNLETHEEVCRWREWGYGKDCVPLPSGPKGIRSKGTATLDKATQEQVILKAAVRDPTMKIGDCTDRNVPQTSDRVFSDFTTDERRALYDHVVALTRDTMPQLREFAMPAVEEARSSGPLTREQLMAKERDAKRRRVRHRTLKVHTLSKNYTQVVREVINNQMSAYEDWLRAYHGAEGGPDSGRTEQAGTEKEEGKMGGHQEMIWVEWDHSCNPHLWWKKVLGREKREKERERMKRRERSGSGSRDIERRREGHGRKENREYRRDRYERDRDRYEGDRRYRGDRHSHNKDRYEEERYSREREKRRRGHESKTSKRSRDTSEEEEPRRKRIARHERKRKTDVRKDNDHSNSGLLTVVTEENENCTQKERPIIEDNLLQTINIEKDHERGKNHVGNEPTNLLQMAEIKPEEDKERDENCTMSEQAVLQHDSLQTVEIKDGEGEERDENSKNEVQSLLGDKLDEVETLDGTETLLGDKLLDTVREKLDRGETLDKSEVKLAQRFLFERLEMIGKAMPSDVSSTYGDSDNSSHPKKLKKKKGKKKKKKTKQKSKNKLKDNKYGGWSDSSD